MNYPEFNDLHQRTHRGRWAPRETLRSRILACIVSAAITAGLVTLAFMQGTS